MNMIDIDRQSAVRDLYFKCEEFAKMALAIGEKPTGEFGLDMVSDEAWDALKAWAQNCSDIQRDLHKGTF